MTRIESLLSQCCIVDALEEEQWQDVEEEVESQTTTNLAREVLKVEQAVSSGEVRDRKRTVEDYASLRVISLLLVN